MLVDWAWFSRFWEKRLPDLKNVISRKTRLKFFTIILFNSRYHYKYNYNILSISNFLIKF